MNRDPDPEAEADIDPIAGGLARELTPPEGLEERVVARLRATGLLGLRPRRWIARDLAAAAAIFFVGLVLGAWVVSGAPDATESGTRFLLLLYPRAGESTSLGNAADELAQEYRAWATALRREGRSITGERLAYEPQRTLGAGDAGALDGSLQGYFVIGADSMEEAARVADGSPHVRHGGRIVVRAIDTP